jgi:hypothetical protein
MAAQKAAAQQINKMDDLQYLLGTPIETLFDDGILFEGESPKDQSLNMTDFIRYREIIQRFSQQLTPDLRDTIVRSVKLCIKPESFQQAKAD